MKKNHLFFIFLLLLFSVSLSELSAQTSQTANAQATYFDTSEFPLWAKDLRRAEIIAFGSFPFMYFFSNFGFDAYRFAANGMDSRYAPWPFKSSAAIEQTQREKLLTLGIAAGGAIVAALVDYGIVRYKRYRQEQADKELPDGTPIIIRKPLGGEETDPAGGEEPLPETENP